MPTVAAAANSTCTAFEVCLRLRRRHQVPQASGFTALPALQRVVSTFVQKSRPAVQTMFFIVSCGTCWTIPSTRHWQVYSSALFAPLAKVRTFIGELFIRLQRYLGLVKSVKNHVEYCPFCRACVVKQSRSVFAKPLFPLQGWEVLSQASPHTWPTCSPLGTVKCREVSVGRRSIVRESHRSDIGPAQQSTRATVETSECRCLKLRCHCLDLRTSGNRPRGDTATFVQEVAEHVTKNHSVGSKLVSFCLSSRPTSHQRLERKDELWNTLPLIVVRAVGPKRSVQQEAEAVGSSDKAERRHPHPWGP